MKYLVKKSESSCPTPGKKIRSQGQGRGMGVGKGKGPIGGAFGRAVASNKKEKEAVMDKESSFGPVGYFHALGALGIKLAGREGQENYHLIHSPLSGAVVGGIGGLSVGDLIGRNTHNAEIVQGMDRALHKAIDLDEKYRGPGISPNIVRTLEEPFKKRLWRSRLLGLGGGAAAGAGLGFLIDQALKAQEGQNAQRAQEE